MVWQGIELHQCLDGGNKIIGNRTADTTIGQLNNIFCRTVRNSTAFQNITINTNITELIHNHSQTPATGLLHELADKCGFS